MLNSRLFGIVVTIFSLIGLGFLLYNFKFSPSLLGLASLSNILGTLGFLGIGIGWIVFPSDPKKGKIINIIGRSILGLALIFTISFLAVRMYMRMS